jgi:hypothetical protein
VNRPSTCRHPSHDARSTRREGRAREYEFRRSPGEVARLLAAALPPELFTRLFEVLDRPDTAETLADAVGAIEEERNPAELAPRTRGSAASKEPRRA